MQPRNNRDVANCVECYASEHNVTEEVAFAAIDLTLDLTPRLSHTAECELE